MHLRKPNEEVNPNRALEDSGLNFHQYCSAFIREKVAMWDVELEEYPVSIGSEHTRIDLVALAEKKFRIVIECKKNNPDYSAWVFSRSDYEKIPDEVKVYKIESGVIIQDQTSFYNGMDSYQAIHACEAKKVINGSKKSFAMETIESACYQISKGLFGLMLEKTVKVQPDFDCYYFPIIITTADIVYCKHDPIKGIGAEKKFRKVKWILYYHGVSSKIWNEATLKAGIDDNHLQKRLPVLIVNFENLGELFGNIVRNFGFFS